MLGRRQNILDAVQNILINPSFPRLSLTIEVDEIAAVVIVITLLAIVVVKKVKLALCLTN
jgi:hypothetical protein